MMAVITKMKISDALYIESQTDLKTYFANVADILLNETTINANKNILRIVEIEFYLNDNKNHQDPFIHGDVHQETPAKWYFHRQNGKSYKAGTYKGLDITFGYKNTKQHVYGGILIRTIQDIKSKKLIEGPCNVVDYILKVCKCKTIQDLVTATTTTTTTTAPGDVFKTDSNSTLYLEPNSTLTKQDIITGPRVGLTLKVPSSAKEEYIFKDYRFMIFGDQIKKNITSVIISLYFTKSLSEDQISQRLKKKKDSVTQVIDTAKEGQSKDIKDYYYKKKLSTNEFYQFYGAWIQKYNNNSNVNVKAGKVINGKKENLIKLGYKDLEDCLKDPNNVYIGRDMSHYSHLKTVSGSKWKNPFTVKQYGRDECLKKYEEYVTDNKELMGSLGELKDKNLVCWCHPESCHADILLKLLK